MNTPIRLNFWSSPRNISTAIMYAFAQRPDTTVVDEPLYAHYLSKTTSKAQHPGHSEILNSQQQDGHHVIQDVIFGTYATKVVFFKQMTHHLIALDNSFLANTDHVMLIRDPRRIIASYAKVIPNPTIDDIGIRKQFDLFTHLKKIGRLKAVLDTKLLLLNPAVVLKKLCDSIGIPFYTEMLSWEAGPIPQDGVWAPYWYENVHRSTGFQPYKEKTLFLREDLAALARQCLPYYEALIPHALQPN